ncbi:hypothetical protein PybrP1_008127 [[Pythium] brassicae (nom. inval.)]|nr:hypothetical protein PybrP1_008127 [[Pythium] brassicae (nom. inval.)]
MHSQKTFFMWFLPLAIATFLSAPLAVLHSFELLDAVVLRLQEHPATAVLSFASASSTTTNFADVAQLPRELPLLFRAETYPSSGQKTLDVQDPQLMDVLFRLLNGSSNASLVGSPFLLGYVPIADARRRPIKANATSTTRSHRFRVKRVRREASSKVLIGHVEWEPQ